MFSTKVVLIVMISILIENHICLPFNRIYFGKSKYPTEKPLMGKPISFCDGEVVGKSICIYKCKLCDMPRIFVMKYGTSLG